jgi:TolB protein
VGLAKLCAIRGRLAPDLVAAASNGKVMMRRSSLLLLLAAFVTVTATPLTARAQIKMQIIGPGSHLSPIAVSALKNLGGDDQHGVSSEFDSILSHDLELSGYFRLISPKAFIEDAQTSGYDLGQFNFADWRSINADFLVKGAVKVQGDQVQLTALLFDVAQQRRMMGKSFTGQVSEVPRMARRFADALLKATTGIEGPFDSKLAFVSTRGGRFKEIYLQSIDGHGLFRLTDNPTINLFPAFDRQGEVLYLSYKTMMPALYLANPATRREVRIVSRRGKMVGGAISPDGQLIVAAIEHSGATNLYLLDRSGQELRRLTNTNGINVNPAFSSDGRMLAFTSDRSGTPQVYVMSIAGGGARRVTYKGNYNTTPAFSPDGKFIAYESRDGGHFDVWIVGVDGSDPINLTHGVGSNQYPAWSPDGRYIAFSSTRNGNSHIYLLQVATQTVISALTEGNGDDSCPAWSWWLGD